MEKMSPSINQSLDLYVSAVYSMSDNNSEAEVPSIRPLLSLLAFERILESCADRAATADNLLAPPTFWIGAPPTFH